MVVPGAVVHKSRQRKRRVSTIPTLGREVLGQYRRVLGQYSLGTVQSWDSGLGTVPGSLGTVQSPGTIQCWDSSLWRVVLGQQSWDSAVLGQWSWDGGLGTVQSWDSSLGTVQSWDSAVLESTVLGQ